jgi:dTDP-4-amino-4,6-dideoxygalactose transaminase
MSLLPNEHWNFRFTDAVRGLLTAIAHQHHAAPQSLLMPGFGVCLPVRSGRSAIVLALKALKLPLGARIGVPLYCCPVVFKAIKAAGFSACFIDVDTDTYCISVADLVAKRPKIDALIAVHMFGNVCDMPRLREAAPRIPFIEDCAQGLGSRINNRLAGSVGEVAFFSFRSGKYLSVGEGGALYSGQPALLARMAELISDIRAASRTEECAHVTRVCLRSLLRTKPLWGLIGDRIWNMYNKKVNYTSQSPLVLGRIYETDRAMTIRRLPLLDSWINRQRFNAEFYSRNLAVDARMLCHEKLGAYYNRLQYPLLMPNPEQCEQLAACLRKNQISTARPYKDIAEIAEAHYGYTMGDCPVAERIARTVLVIPCNHALKARDVERVTQCVNDAWAQICGRRAGRTESAVTSTGTGM